MRCCISGFFLSQSHLEDFLDLPLSPRALCDTQQWQPWTDLSSWAQSSQCRMLQGDSGVGIHQGSSQALTPGTFVCFKPAATRFSSWNPSLSPWFFYQVHPSREHPSAAITREAPVAPLQLFVIKLSRSLPKPERCTCPCQWNQWAGQTKPKFYQK